MNTSIARWLTLAALGLNACQSNPTTETAAAGGNAAPVLTPGPWRGVLATQGQEIPFLFEVKTEAGKPVVYLINKGLDGEERLRCEEISSAGDSTTIRLHPFDAALVVRDAGEGKLKGTWVKYDAQDSYRVPMTAVVEPTEELSNRLFPDEVSETDKFTLPFDSRLENQQAVTYRAEFKDEQGKTCPAVGVLRFDTESGNLFGEFFTTSGDYRCLFGNRVKTKGKPRVRLSSFDGNHAFLFDAVDSSIGLSSLKGDFYSGKSGHETWTAVLDPNAKRPSTSKGFR
ncbi:hypothetical protein [Hymenobacter sp. IS2118]|uniref:hypothetical protein n=1 Tax=Hymenobacter sp. IS2118 TaxID=1505605 RepID=UPI00054D1B1B|nr:hypothetical protein [Hymenobacter sp. IS2118]